MKGLFVSYNLAVILKASGFDEPCFGFYVGKTKEFRYNHSGNPEMFKTNSEWGNTEITINLPEALVAAKYKSDGFDIKQPELITSEIISAPLYHQVINWFREFHKIKIIESEYYSDLGDYWYVKQYREKERFVKLENAIDYALILIK